MYVCVCPPTCRQAERCGNPVSYSERQTYESHQWSEETVSQLQPLQLFNASLRCQHRPRGRARQGLAVCLFLSDSHRISLTDQSLLRLWLCSLYADKYVFSSWSHKLRNVIFQVFEGAVKLSHFLCIVLFKFSPSSSVEEVCLCSVSLFHWFTAEAFSVSRLDWSGRFPVGHAFDKTQ